MAILYFRVSAQYDEVIRLRQECEKLEAQLKRMDVNKSPAAAKALETQLASARQQMMGLVTEAAKAGAVMENDLKKKLNSASKASDELTEEIIKQRKIIRDTQDDVRRLSDEYSKMGKYSPNSKAKLAELNRAKAALNEQRRYGGVVVNIEFKIGEESYCEKKDPNASLNIQDVELMKFLAIVLTEKKRLSGNGNIDIGKTFIERVKGMLGTVNRDLGGKDIKEALQEYVETLKKGDNTDDVEYDDNLVKTLSKIYNIAIKEAEKDEDGNISLVASKGETSNINGWTFCDNNDIKSIKFSRGITQIDEDAITNCQVLKSVSFPASIREISEGAISSCDALERLIVESGNRRYRSVNDCIIDIKAHQLVLGCKSSVIPDDGSVLSIRAFAFSGYKGLDITIPAGIEMIQDNAFFNCSGIIRCEVTSKPDGWNKMWVSTGSELAVKWKEIPKPQTALAVLSTTLPQNMVEASPQKAKENADKRPQNFALAKDLTKKYGIDIIAAEEDESGKYKITISGEEKVIPAHKFKNIKGIAQVIIEDGVTSVGEYAFRGCTDLTSITIPDSVTSIGDWAFFDCSGLTDVYYQGDLSGWLEIDFADSFANPMYYADNLYINGELLQGEIVIPEGTETIGDCAFSGCTGLTSVTIPDSVTSIGDWAFSGCRSLTSIIIPDSVIDIGSRAFSGCTGLTSIVVEDGNPVYHSAGNCLIETATKTLIAGCKTSVIPDDGSVTSIGEFAFSGRSSLTSVTIPYSVTSIGSGAFSGCRSLTSIIIPDSVTSIGDWAFSGCTGLTSIKIPDSVTSIGYFAFA